MSSNTKLNSSVYVLRHEQMPGILKIGYTEGEPQKRCDDLFNTSVPAPFALCYYVKVLNGYVLEQKIHRRLNSCRVRKDREFFCADFDSVVNVIQQVLAKEAIDYENEIIYPPSSTGKHPSYSKFHVEHIRNNHTRPHDPRKDASEKEDSLLFPYTLFATIVGFIGWIMYFVERTQ